MKDDPAAPKGRARRRTKDRNFIGPLIEVWRRLKELESRLLRLEAVVAALVDQVADKRRTEARQMTLDERSIDGS